MNTMNACKWLWLVEEGIGFRSTIPRLNSQGADLPAGPAAKALQKIAFPLACLKLACSGITWFAGWVGPICLHAKNGLRDKKMFVH